MSRKRPNLKINLKKKSRANSKIGKAPGSVNYLGNREGTPTTINILEYNEDYLAKNSTTDILEIETFNKSSKTTWIDIIGISDEAYIEKLGASFNLNALSLEDAVNTNQRPKIDEYEGYIFGVFKMLYLNPQAELVSEHLALILLPNSVLVFQELEEDVFEGVRNRINTKLGRIRTRGADYLFFALLDSVIDNYFVVLEHFNNKIEQLEEEVYENPTPETAQKIQELKKEILKIRKWIFPVKELISKLIDTENELINKDTKLFLKDLMDHCMEINETLQIYREMSMSLMDMYMSNVSNKTNEVMKVLTIMSSIFIPMTFIAGIYGMNFDKIPELHWKYGYFGVWGVMLIIFIGMLIFFKKKGWL